METDMLAQQTTIKWLFSSYPGTKPEKKTEATTGKPKNLQSREWPLRAEGWVAHIDGIKDGCRL